MARTTAVELKGDRYKAEQLSLAHINRLLRTFRENSAFQSLQQNKHEENFFDETGAYIGKISMQTVFGVEKVIVDVRSGKPRPQKEAWKTDSRLVSQIVPCIRSVDNLWWVACLSGTFEGPYYAFKNIYEIPAEEMADDTEVALDNKLISVGTAPLGGGGPPKLFFIAQTGERAEIGDGALNEDISITSDPRYEIADPNLIFTNYMASLTPYYELCMPLGISVGYYDLSFSCFDTFYRDFTVWGELLDAPKRKFHYGKSYEGQSIRLGGDPPGVLNHFGGEYHVITDYVVPAIKGIRAERENVNNSACCYAEFITDQDATYSNPYADCVDAVNGVAPDPLPETIYRKPYYFQVGELTYQFYEPPLSEVVFPPGLYVSPWMDNLPGPQVNVEDNMMKYYGPESRAAMTGIMCGRVDTQEFTDDQWHDPIEGTESCLGFYYNYIGPRNENEITTTVFIPDNGEYEHIIPGVMYEGEDIIFKGEIFLGMIQYTVTEKKQVYS